MPTTYDAIGSTYGRHRHPDPRWTARIEAALGDASTVVNVGAGTGSYEPVSHRRVVAVEPSTEMIRQRPAGSAPVIRAVAESLPFGPARFDVALALLTTHHWTDPVAGYSELRRVASRQVILTWDPVVAATRFWLVRDYLPEANERERDLATLSTAVDALEMASVDVLSVPSDMTDGVFGAYWKRPHAYLDRSVRQAISGRAGTARPACRRSSDVPTVGRPRVGCVGGAVRTGGARGRGDRPRVPPRHRGRGRLSARSDGGQTLRWLSDKGGRSRSVNECCAS